MDGKTALGASSPANPALHIPEPLSTTRAAASSSHILSLFYHRVSGERGLRYQVLALTAFILMLRRSRKECDLSFQVEVASRKFEVTGIAHFVGDFKV